MRVWNIPAVDGIKPNMDSTEGFHSAIIGFRPLSLYRGLGKLVLILSCSSVGRGFLRRVHPRLYWEVSVVKVDSRIVGFAYLEGHESPKIFHSGICIKEGFRGSNLGVRLLEKILSLAKDRGGEKVYVSIYSDNLEAQSLYGKFGFKPMATIYGKEV